MAAVFNRVVGSGLIVLGVSVIAFGVFMGAFGWLNDGATAGLRLLLITGGFGLAAVAMGGSFLLVSRAMAAGSRWRWWMQVVVPVLTIYLAFGLAAEFSVLVDRLLR